MLGRLALPDPKTWPPAQTEPLASDLGIEDDDGDDESEDDESDDAPDEKGRYAFRVPADAGDRYRVWGVLAGGLVGGAIAITLGPRDPAVVKTIVTLLPAAIGWFSFQVVGRKRREDTCAQCETRLPVWEDRCATCRAPVVAEVHSAAERLDLEDRIERIGLERALQGRPR